MATNPMHWISIILGDPNMNIKKPSDQYLITLKETVSITKLFIIYLTQDGGTPTSLKA